jgi:RimJ/RimL family protein N-acetyltransferase
MTLSGPRVTLRTPHPADRDDRLAEGIDLEYAYMVGVEPVEAQVTEQLVERWYDWLSAQAFGWVIECDGHCVGEVRLHSLNGRDRRARFAIGIFDSGYRGQGIGTEATRLVLTYAFDTLRLHRVDLRVLAYNHRAIALYRRCGFVQEGVERESAWIDNRWHSDVMMSLLEDEWRTTNGTLR